MSIDFCPHGHRFTAANTRQVTADGKKYRQCRTCAAARMRLKYGNDSEHREEKKRRNLERYHVRLAQARGIESQHHRRSAEELQQ